MEPDPIDAAAQQKLTRVPGVHPADRDARLRRLLAAIDADDRVAAAVVAALNTVEADAAPDAALAELDSWWGLEDYLARGSSNGTIAGDVERLATICDAFGDTIGASAYRSLPETAHAIGAEGASAAYMRRAKARADLVPVELRDDLGVVDAHVARFLAARQPDALAAAGTAWHAVLMNEARLNSPAPLQAGLMLDAAIVLRDASLPAVDRIRLDRLVRCWQAAFHLFRDRDLVPAGGILNLAPRLDMAVYGYSCALMRRYRLDGRPDDLANGVQHLEFAVLLAPVGTPAFSQRLAELSAVLHEQAGEADVVRAHDLIYFAAALEQDNARRIAYLALFARQAWTDYARFQTLSSLWQALAMIETLRAWPEDVAAALPDETRRGLQQLAAQDVVVGEAIARIDTAKPMSVANLIQTLANELWQDVLWTNHALFLLAKTTPADLAIDGVNALAAEALTAYEDANDLRLIDRAVDALETLLGHSASDDGQRRIAAANLAVGLAERYQRQGNVNDLARAIEVTTALVTRPPNDARSVRELGGLLMLRHRLSRSRQDLDEAIRLLEQAMALMPDAPRAGDAGALAVALLDRWQVTLDVTDIERAIAELDRALAGSPSPAEVRELQATKALCLRARYDASDNVGDLQAAVALCRRILAALPSASKERAGVLHTLGISLRSMNTRNVDRATLDEAVETLQTATDETPTTAADWPTYLSDLGTALTDRYEAFGKLEDLDASIAIHRRALGAGPLGADGASIAANLAGSLLQRFRHTRATEDLDAAVAAAERATGDTPGSARHSGTLSTLGNVLFQRVIQASDRAAGRPLPPEALDDLRRARTALEEAVAGARSDANRATALNNLGLVLYGVYDLTGDAAALVQSARVIEDAIGVGAALTSHLPGFWVNLAVARKAQAIASAVDVDVIRAVSAFRRAAELAAVRFSDVAIAVGHSWGDWAMRRGAFAEAAEAYGGALRALGDLFRVQVTRQQKESWLRDAQEFSLLAAYALAKTGAMRAAVEAFEHGRAMVLSEALQIDRAVIERLGTDHADLVERFRQAAARWKRLSVDAPVAGEGLRGQSVEEALRDARSVLDAAICEIRALDGHADFMKPAGFDVVAAVSEQAPLIYLGATVAGGIALVVRGADRPPVAVWLPELTVGNLDQQLQEYGRAYVNYRSATPTPEARAAWPAAIDALTAWAWTAAMAPIVDAVGDAPLTTLVPAGLLGLVPLHATWVADPTNARTGRRYALDATSWSYAPSAQVIAAARASKADRAERMVAVDEPTLGRAELALPFSAIEVAAATATFPDHQILAHDSATPENTLRALASASHVHLSCHGAADFRDPMRSALVMAGGVPLRLADILRERLDADLIVLSACESGIIGTELPDEVVSLPAGFMQAGAAAAVSSMWTVPSLATAMLMFRFYEIWRTTPQARPVDALRQAQVWVRDTTNGEKAAHFRAVMRGASAGASTRAAETLWRELFTADPMSRSESHPYHWAAFTYLGSSGCTVDGLHKRTDYSRGAGGNAAT